jgi:hypothetical protein
MNAVTINDTQRLFVLKSTGGYSCLGFDVVFKRLSQYANALGRALPSITGIGKIEQYQEYLVAESAYIATNPKNTFFDADTPAQVQSCLEFYRISKVPVRLFYGNAETGKDWLEENDVYGTIGRSMGPIKVPLLIAKGAAGGGAILTTRILRIVDGATNQEVYRHSNYQAPVFTSQKSDVSGYQQEVLADGVVVARFKDEAKANAWTAFMQGIRMTTARAPARRVW